MNDPVQNPLLAELTAKLQDLKTRDPERYVELITAITKDVDELTALLTPKP
jgi:hypothetical protein